LSPVDDRKRGHGFVDGTALLVPKHDLEGEHPALAGKHDAVNVARASVFVGLGAAVIAAHVAGDVFAAGFAAKVSFVAYIATTMGLPPGVNPMA
jgi:hypothetical protein